MQSYASLSILKRKIVFQKQKILLKVSVVLTKLLVERVRIVQNDIGQASLFFENRCGLKHWQDSYSDSSAPRSVLLSRVHSDSFHKISISFPKSIFFIIFFFLCARITSHYSFGTLYPYHHRPRIVLFCPHAYLGLLTYDWQPPSNWLVVRMWTYCLWEAFEMFHSSGFINILRLCFHQEVGWQTLHDRKIKPNLSTKHGITFS